MRATDLRQAADFPTYRDSHPELIIQLFGIPSLGLSTTYIVLKVSHSERMTDRWQIINYYSDYRI